MKYSLANYRVSIKPNDPQMLAIFGVITIGGEGSTTDNISVSTDENLWSVEGFKTGGYVHNKSLNRTGTISISVSQLSNAIVKYKLLANKYYTGDYDGLTISVTDNDDVNEVVSAIDCYPEKIPDTNFAGQASSLTMSFICGKITYN